MNQIAGRLRIGEKLVLGFGAVALIFLTVIWHDQRELRAALEQHRALHLLAGARQEAALAIERHLIALRDAEARFLVARDPLQAERVRREGAALLDWGARLARIDVPAEAAAVAIRASLGDYLVRFGEVEAAWHRRGLDHDSGLQGDFRASAHALEARLAQWAPALERELLQLRRREKDYLLRGADGYAVLVEHIAAALAQGLAAAALETEERVDLERLLEAYLRDFRALVEQDREIALLREQMDRAAAAVTPLVERALAAARARLEETVQAIDTASAERARRNLYLALAATLVGTLLALVFTVRLVRPVREMAGLLDRLTYENPRQRIPTRPGARDEIDAMARSLNTLADHRAIFSHWWRNAMAEAIALRDLQLAETPGAEDAARARLRRANRERARRLRVLRARCMHQLERIRTLARAPAARGRAERDRERAVLRHASESLATLLQLLDDPLPEPRRAEVPPGRGDEGGSC
ncbi:hypothetical protein [Marichromatium bheemlicum]|uniref:HAMP domain-containing protein n=1 Tax=Marichromatium bheemlicum TaxID=365339 RepID=A0ABX1I557_9GAMM|nr:hypothetical protein [Marichromatium bheemlicum]NKN32266.1 hypothetical protein [Marichromatium bheemlicum]